jgi:2-dehydro-3-deoxyphosphogluconate aldolase/(4S)-4-hydroxy-2-oxoglutarate aldolase
LPNVACVGGSWMLPKEALASGDYAVVERLAREAAGLERK